MVPAAMPAAVSPSPLLGTRRAMFEPLAPSATRTAISRRLSATVSARTAYTPVTAARAR